MVMWSFSEISYILAFIRLYHLLKSQSFEFYIITLHKSFRGIDCQVNYDQETQGRLLALHQQNPSAQLLYARQRFQISGTSNSFMLAQASTCLYSVMFLKLCWRTGLRFSSREWSNHITVKYTTKTTTKKTTLRGWGTIQSHIALASFQPSLKVFLKWSQVPQVHW